MTDTFHRWPKLALSSTIYVTGTSGATPEVAQEKFGQITDAGATLKRRRMAEHDMMIPGVDSSTTWYVCVGPALKQKLRGWLDESQLVSEEFSY